MDKQYRTGNIRDYFNRVNRDGTVKYFDHEGQSGEKRIHQKFGDASRSCLRGYHILPGGKTTIQNYRPDVFLTGENRGGGCPGTESDDADMLSLAASLEKIDSAANITLVGEYGQAFAL